ncbi:MAG: hypothetical protein MUO31_13210 [Thermodesulfovibrionales bacterium]|nr:hypothetical protein [Thermodesulfovibrionales bacterium]
MEFVGVMQQGKLTLSVSQSTLRRRYLCELKDNTQISEEIKPIRKSKTHKQVRTIFGLAIQTILDDFEDRGIGTDELLGLSIPTGNPISKGMMKEYLYSVCPIYSEDGKRITLSHKDCTTKCAADFFTAIRNFMASQWGVYISEPDPNWDKPKESLK